MGEKIVKITLMIIFGWCMVGLVRIADKLDFYVFDGNFVILLMAFFIFELIRIKK